MATTLTRVRWNDTELERIAREMVRLQSEGPSLGLLEAARAAQSVLDVERRRDIPTWGVLEKRLQPWLDLVQGAGPAPEGKVQASLVQQAPPEVSAFASPQQEGGLDAREEQEAPDASEAEDVQEAQGEGGDATVVLQVPVQEPLCLEPAPQLAEPRSPHSAVASPVAEPPARPAVDALMTEAALLAALQSPVVEAALVELFGKALTKVLARVNSDMSAATHAPSPVAKRRRVLVAGFPAPEARMLEQTLESRFEVRVWKPAQGPQLFQTLANICSVAVLPEETDDDVDESLRAMNLKLIRHAGSPSRLLDQIERLG